MATTVTLRAGNNSRGFSLLELVLVLMVLALSSFVVIPNIEKKLEDRAIRTSALGLAAVARDLRSRALDQGIAQRLIINVARNSYIGAQRPEVYLPADVRFAGITGGEIVDHDVRQFVFFANGSAEPGEIALSRRENGLMYFLRFEPLTGKVEVGQGGGS